MTGIIWLYIGLNTLASRADRHATDGRGDGWAEESRDEHKDRALPQKVPVDPGRVPWPRRSQFFFFGRIPLLWNPFQSSTSASGTDSRDATATVAQLYR
jgi:hypothetical protein